MPHSNWKGHISFGLVNIPIILYNAHEPSSDISFRQINKNTGAKIKYKRVDSETGKEVPWDQIGKGFEYSKDVILPVAEGELERLAGENARTIAIEEFVDKKNIKFLNIDKTYFLVPDKKGEKSYVILREALNGTNKVGIAKVIISTREYLAAVAPFEHALVLYLLHYHDELRKLADFDIPTQAINTYKISKQEINIAKKLIAAMSTKWRHEKYQDEYKKAVKKWVAAKIHHQPPSKMRLRGHRKQKGDLVNFVDLLRKSLATSKPIKKRTLGKNSKDRRVTHRRHGHKKEALH